MEERERPGFEAVPQVAPHAGHGRAKRATRSETARAVRTPDARPGRQGAGCACSRRCCAPGAAPGRRRRHETKRNRRRRATGAGAARSAAARGARGAGAGRESAGPSRRSGADRRGAEFIDLFCWRRALRLQPRSWRGRASSRYDSSSSRSKQRWKYSATTGRSASSHLLTNDRRNATRRVAEDLDVLGPGDHGARRHQRRQVAGGEALARQLGHRDHRAHQRAAGGVGQRGHARLHDRHLFVGAAGSSARRRCSSGRSARG